MFRSRAKIDRAKTSRKRASTAWSIGACSIFLHEQTFRSAVERAGLNPYLYYHIGLREQDQLGASRHSQRSHRKSHAHDDGGVAKARHMQPAGTGAPGSGKTCPGDRRRRGRVCAPRWILPAAA
ncbi:MAG: hypothetical protein MZV63_72155 [Marinilabiliales bacterium]|nr:hypothetical protein [Marinilabiliales bacterium]